MARFNDAWMETLLGKNDIVSIVSEYVSLRPKGRKLWGLCPFHNEKTPSFSVSEDRQLYYCFGCGAGGGTIQFIMDVERLPYVEAIEYLAQRVGLDMPEEVDDEALRRERAKRERLYEACKAAAQYYYQQLLGKGGEAARGYLARRGLDAAVVQRFGLGYAPDSWDSLMTTLTEKGYSEQDLLDAGLLVRNAKSGRVYDAYRNRVIFPIIGTNSRVLGFGARTMGEDIPKYINTGDTPVYSKRRNLYALNLLRNEKSPDAIIVEGYMDVISLYAGGIRNAVASLGTALTQQQARLLKRYVPAVFIAYDGDSAGQNATLRGLDLLSNEGLQVRVITMPNGEDPDDFIRKNGKDAFDDLKDKALSLNAFKLRKMGQEFDLSTEDGRQEYAMAGCRFIATLQPVEQERYYHTLSRSTGLSLEALKAQGARTGVSVNTSTFSAKTKRSGNRGLQESDRPERERIQLLVLRTLLQSMDTADILAQSGYTLKEIFSKEELYSVAQSLIQAHEDKKETDIRLLMSTLLPEQASVMAGLLEEEQQTGDLHKFILDCAKRIRMLDLEEEMQLLRKRVDAEELPLEEKLNMVKRLQQLDILRRELK